MRLVVGLVLAFALTGCGKDKDDDAKKSENSPETETIPADFTNTATTSTAFKTASTNVKADIKDSGSKMAFSTEATAAFMAMLTQADTDESVQEEKPNFKDLGVKMAAGGDCSGQFLSFDKQYDEMLSTLTGIETYVNQLGADFSAAGLESQYTVTQLDKGKQFAFNFKIEPKSGASPIALPGFDFKSTTQFAGGSTDNSLVIKLVSDVNFTITQEGKTQASSFHNDVNFFADRAAKTIKSGFKVKGSSTGGEAAQNVTYDFSAASTLTGGDKPALEYTFVGTSSESGGNADMKVAITKVDTNTYKLTISGTIAGQAQTSEATVVNDGKTCKVTTAS
jgi:hypothetical protein